MIGRRFTIIVTDKETGENGVELIEIIKEINEKFVEEKEIVAGETNEFFVNDRFEYHFLYFNVYTRAVGKCSENQLLFDVTGIEELEKLEHFLTKSEDLVEKCVRSFEMQQKAFKEIDDTFDDLFVMGVETNDIKKHLLELVKQRYESNEILNEYVNNKCNL